MRTHVHCSENPVAPYFGDCHRVAEGAGSAFLGIMRSLSTGGFVAKSVSLQFMRFLSVILMTFLNTCSNDFRDLLHSLIELQLLPGSN